MFDCGAADPARRDLAWYLPSRQAVITDPWFILVAIPAVTFLGLAKGGFAGIGMAATPLMALTVPPLQAAAILLPILMVQDVISVAHGAAGTSR